ncbi:hypothetical protein MMC22_005691 [Lobaria immixta]|nr:hypothetical protein [Lobaria immixta]
MVTPFDAAAGAAGLVSVGLKACEGILAYYNKYNDFRSDLAEACIAIELLEATLKDIESKLQSRFLTLSQKDHIGRYVGACRGGIFELYVSLAKIEKGPLLLQKIVYPFKESTMSKGLQRISELQKSLAVALIGLNMYVMFDNDDKGAHLYSDTLESVSATKEALDAMSEDYSDGLSELTGTVTALTSLANAKKICPRPSHRTGPAAQRSILGGRVHGGYEKIAVLLFHRDCKTLVGQRDPLAEMLALETLLNDRFPCQPKAKRYALPGLDQTDPRSIKMRIHKLLSDLLFYEDSDNTLLLVHYAGFHSTSSTLGAGSNKDRDALRLRNDAQLDQIIRDEVESFLQTSEKSDILMVFDCYYSGKLEGQNFEPIITPPYPSDTTRVLGRKLEFLGSIMSERRAQSTNSRSLTSAFTWTLDKAVERMPRRLHSSRYSHQNSDCPRFLSKQINTPFE